MAKERNVLSQILKSWAQEHDINFVIASPALGDEGVDTTGGHLTWIIKNTNANIDLISLLNRLEMYVNNVVGKKFPDGMFCRKCQVWYQYAEPNQEDGSLLCYSCRNNPYS